MVETTSFAALTMIQSALIGTIAAQSVPRLDVLGSATARGIVVLRASFADSGPLHSFRIDIGTDGLTFVDARVGPTRGTRLSGSLLPVSKSNQNVVLMVPVIGRFDLTPQGFLFPTAGTYYLRWNIAFRDLQTDALAAVQTIRVDEPRADDLEFLRRISEPTFAESTFGIQSIPSEDRDYVALGLVAEFLKLGQSDPTEEGPLGIGLSSADALMTLAKALPASSYAPYAAYYAGGVYRIHLSQLPEFQDLNPALGNHAQFRQCDDALRFVMEHGDAFLRPRSYCCRAQLHVMAAAFGEARADLKRAIEESGGQGAVEHIVERMIADIAREKARARKRMAPSP